MAEEVLVLRHVAKYILKELYRGGISWRFIVEVYLFWRHVLKVSKEGMWRRLIVEGVLVLRHVAKYILKELCGGGLPWRFI